MIHILLYFLWAIWICSFTKCLFVFCRIVCRSYWVTGFYLHILKYFVELFFSPLGILVVHRLSLSLTLPFSWTCLSQALVFKSSPKDMLIDFRERWREGERERETLIWEGNVNQLPLAHVLLIRDQTCNLGLCLVQEWNLSKTLWCTGWRSHQLSHASQGLSGF